MTQSSAESAAATTGGRREEAPSSKFGVVLFDDMQNPSAAWVAVNGGPARRVDGINQLPTDALYWTNLTYETFFSASKAHINPWLRHENYLVAKPKDVLVEWDLDPAATPPDYAAEMLSTMFQRVMTLAFRLARECNERLRMPAFFRGKTLTDDMLCLLPQAEFPKGEAASIMKAGQAFAQFSKTAVRGIKGARQFRLRRPRIPYALEMLTTPVPMGPWEFMSKSDLRGISPDRIAWVRGTDRPCMVEVTVDSMQQDVAPIYGFGNSTDRDRRIPRSWVAHPEFLAMSSFSDLDVRSAWVGKDYGQLNLKLPEPVRRFLSDRHIEASWSAGIVAETLWRAACVADGRSGQPGEERAQTSWRGAWVRAADKTNGFMSAMSLTDMGYTVASYGYGWLFCQVTEDQIPDLVRDGLTLGLLPNLFDVPPNLFGPRDNVPWGGDKLSRILSQLTVTKQKQMLWNLDRLPLFEGEQRDAMLKRIVQAHKNQRI